MELVKLRTRDGNLLATPHPFLDRMGSARAERGRRVMADVINESPGDWDT